MHIFAFEIVIAFLANPDRVRMLLKCFAYLSFTLVTAVILRVVFDLRHSSDSKTDVTAAICSFADFDAELLHVIS